MSLNFQPNYCSDQMAVLKNLSFLTEERFQRGYNRACVAGGFDWGIHWRFHTCLWAAQNGLSLDGDFVECGVAKGFYSSGIMKALNWNETGRKFFLFDTFEGVLEELCTEEEKIQMLKDWGGVDAHNQKLAMYYADSYESVRENFSEWEKAILVKGPVPHTLEDIDIEKVAYLHIDMNCVVPEMEAIEFFWPKLSEGACVVLDDYAFYGYDLQHRAWDDWALKNNRSILSIPTGQGLILK